MTTFTLDLESGRNYGVMSDGAGQHVVVHVIRDNGSRMTLEPVAVHTSFAAAALDARRRNEES